MKRIALVLTLLAAAATPAVAGPPWITVELRPMGDVVAWARTWHHGTPMALPLTGTAEGLVNGQRRSVPLRFDTTSEANAFAIMRTWGTEGVWVLTFGVSAGEHGNAGAAIGVDRAGTAAFVRFPRTLQGGSRTATRSEIDVMLRALEDGRQPPVLGRAGFGGLLWTFGPVIVLLITGTILVRVGAVVLRRVRAVA